MKTAALLMTMLLLVIGCADVQKRTYDVTVKNDSAKFVTVWLTKNGPAYGEPGWKAPEDIGLESLKQNEPIGGMVIPPGRIGYTGKVTGQFAPEASALLRIYVGKHTDLNEILAISHDSPDRLEVELKPGENHVLIKDDGGSVHANRLEP